MFQIVGQPRLYFSMPMEGVAEPMEEAELALQVREQIVYFLAAAYDPPGPREWMEEIEQEGGDVTVWLDFRDIVADDIDREAVRKEFEKWLQTDRS